MTTEYRDKRIKVQLKVWLPDRQFSVEIVDDPNGGWAGGVHKMIDSVSESAHSWAKEEAGSNGDHREEGPRADPGSAGEQG